MAALAAAQNPGPVGEAERFPSRLAIGADEPVAPPHLLQVGGTRSVVGEQPLKLGKRAWKRQLIALQNVHARPIQPADFRGDWDYSFAPKPPDD